jgi:hypothetical protein
MEDAGDRDWPRAHDGAGSLSGARRALVRARADREWAAAERQRAEQRVARMQADAQQRLIDAEVAETRRLLLKALRRRGGTGAAAFLDEDFLAIADKPAVVAAILDAATTAGGADFCDLQLYDPVTASLRMEALRGFSADFAVFFATVDATSPTACAAALTTRQAVLVDDVAHSPVFDASPALVQLRAAGSRAVRSYPLLAASGELYGVLSLHYRQRAPRRGNPGLVAAAAARALRRHREERP